jgi:hypothetical protein
MDMTRIPKDRSGAPRTRTQKIATDGRQSDPIYGYGAGLTQEGMSQNARPYRRPVTAPDRRLHG